VQHDGTNERNIEMMNQCVTSRATRRRTDVGHGLIVCRTFYPRPSPVISRKVSNFAQIDRRDSAKIADGNNSNGTKPQGDCAAI
jgi:hypothetical protein